MFFHEHVHSSYSLLDGYNPIDRMVQRLKELGMTACALTDHQSLGGIPEWQETCEINGIKPLLGVEGYYTWDCNKIILPIEERYKLAYEGYKKDNPDVPDTCPAKVDKALREKLKPYMYDTHSYHIILIAMNQTGWKNLIKLQSIASDKYTFNKRWHLDDELLSKYNEGIICSTACISSAPSRMLQAHKEELAEKIILKWKEIFKDRLYLEIQPLNISEQYLTNQFYMNMAKKHNIKVIATNDVHWTRYEDYDDHDTLLCIGTGKKKADTDRMKYSNEFWIRSEEEMEEAFLRSCDEYKNVEAYKTFFREAMDNTVELANRCDEHIELGSPVPLFSKVDTPDGLTSEQYLTLLSWKGLYKYLAEHPECNRQIYETRLSEELNVINTKGFAPYMLTVREYIQWANANNNETGPGRGSAAGSLCLLCLGITKNIDPIKNQLLFSRFLTMDRKDPPDIDVDFRDVKALEKHLEDKYGVSNVAKIGTYTTMGVKSGLKDVCRVLNVPFLESNAITKRIDEVCVGQAQPTFADYDDLANGTEQEKEEWNKFHAIEEEYPEYFRLARAFEGSPKNFGVHASGVLVTPMPITDMFPIHRQYQGAGDTEGIPVTLWTGPQLEHCGAIKYDVLGLATIDIFYNTLQMIDKNLTFDDLYKKVDINDASLYKYIQTQKTEGVFQLESNLMKGLIKDMQPTQFNDIVAINASGRPGPLSANFHKLYGEGKKGNITEPPIRGCEDILGPTYNVPIFQEQLMLISKKVSGFDDMQADSITRKITAKKKRSMFPMMIRCHIYGKKNCEGPKGWENDDHAPWYDPKSKYGKEIPGGLVNGYTEQELLDYFHKIEGFSSYAFNKSHSACYAYLGVIGAYLKKNYPEEYMSAVLNNCKDSDAQAFYINCCEQTLNIKVLPPDINRSKEGFIPDKDTHSIIYGLGGVKGVGMTAVPSIVTNAPYTSLEDAYERIPKSSFNKRVSESLIKAGAFDSFNPDRVELLNKLHILRNDRIKENGKLVRDADGNCIIESIKKPYDMGVCMKFEEETLGCHITYKTWWEELKINEGHTFIAKIKSVTEHKQKNGQTMAFIAVKDTINKFNLECCAFAKTYKNIIAFVYGREGELITISGKKSDKGSFIINDVKPFQVFTKKKIEVAS